MEKEIKKVVVDEANVFYFAQKPFTSLDISNGVKKAGFWISHTEVAEYLRGLYDDSELDNFRTNYEFADVEVKSGIFARVYFERNGSVYDYTGLGQDAICPKEFEKMHGYNPIEDDKDVINSQQNAADLKDHLLNAPDPAKVKIEAKSKKALVDNYPAVNRRKANLDFVRDSIQNALDSGKFFSITFIKKDGSERIANIQKRTIPTKTGKRSTTAHISKYMTLWDRNKQDYINVNLDNVNQLKISGMEVNFK